MVNQKFEEIISNEKHLNVLLNEERITVFSEFSKKEYQTEEFKEYIKPKYNQIFREIFSNTQESNTGKRTALLRSLEFLATNDFKHEIYDELVIFLNNTHKNIIDFKKVLMNSNPTELQNKLDQNSIIALNFDSIFDDFHIGIYNILDKETKIKEIKNEIIDELLSICEEVSMANPKKEVYKYAIYNVIMNNIGKIHVLTSEQKNYFETHKSKISNKRNVIDAKYYLYIVLVVILLIIKFASKIK